MGTKARVRKRGNATHAADPRSGNDGRQRAETKSSVHVLRRKRRLQSSEKSTPTRKRGDGSLTLREIRRRLTLVMSAATVCSAALRTQRSDSDDDVALVLQRCVSDELDRLAEEIGAPLNFAGDGNEPSAAK
jgi:hypothetical protein